MATIETAASGVHPVSSSRPQIQRERKLGVRHRRRGLHLAGRVAVAEEAGEAAAFGFVAVHGEGFIAPAAWVGDMVGAAAEGTLIAHRRLVEVVACGETSS